MAVESPPAFTQAGSFSAEQTRRAVFAWAARTAANSPGIISGGLLSATDCQVTAPASGLSVNVGTGEMLIGGTEGGSQGGYGPCRITSQTNLSIAANGSGNPRIDLVCGTVNDAQYTAPAGGVASGQWAPIVLTGTPTASASLTNLLGAPALPGSSLLLAYVLVPTGASSIVTADIANKATVVTPQFFGTSGLGDGQPLVYNGTTGQWRSLAAKGGNATFLQLPAAATVSLTWGIFATGTGTITTSGSGDWSLSSLSTGLATIDFPTRAAAPAVLVTALFNGTATVAQTDAITTSTTVVFTTQGGTNANSSVSFAIIG